MKLSKPIQQQLARPSTLNGLHSTLAFGLGWRKNDSLCTMRAMTRISSREYETVPPEPAALVQSLRAFSYELPDALDDFAENVLLHFHSDLITHR